jgi:hypothetical protein
MKVFNRCRIVHAISRQTSQQARHNAHERQFWQKQIRAAWGLNVITLLGAVFALFTVIVLVCTLDEAKRATSEVNRAFVYFAPPELHLQKDEIKHINSWKLSVPIGNSGNTPTKNLLYRVGCASNFNGD